MGKVAIGVDLGGTNMRFGLVDEKGCILARERAKTRREEGPEKVIRRIRQGIKALADKAAKAGHSAVGAGVGVPGIISGDEGVVRFSPNLPGWVDIALKARIESGLGMPVVVENDANAYAWGEAWTGAGMGAGSLVCMTLGTGVGGGIVVNGRIWRGADGMAGEVGHITVEPKGLQCHCGNRGCLEQYSSATAVVTRVATLISDGKRSSLSELYYDDPLALTAKAVEEAAIKGDRLAKGTFEYAGRYLGIAVADLINLLNIERVVIGGGMAGAWALFIDALRKEVKERAFNIPAGRCKILPATLADDAGVLGAARLALDGRRA